MALMLCKWMEQKENRSKHVHEMTFCPSGMCRKDKTIWDVQTQTDVTFLHHSTNTCQKRSPFLEFFFFIYSFYCDFEGKTPQDCLSYNKYSHWVGESYLHSDFLFCFIIQLFNHYFYYPCNTTSILLIWFLSINTSKYFQLTNRVYFVHSP